MSHLELKPDQNSLSHFSFFLAPNTLSHSRLCSNLHCKSSLGLAFLQREIRERLKWGKVFAAKKKIVT